MYIWEKGADPQASYPNVHLLKILVLLVGNNGATFLYTKETIAILGCKSFYLM